MITNEFLSLRKQIIEKDFSKMNSRQQQAIFHTEGPLLILAGAGSGKTTVIVNRIANIIKYGKAYNSQSADFEPSESDIAKMRQYLNGDESVYFDIERFLTDNPAKPWQILAITFTNKAANELKERLGAMLGERANDIWASTFHSCCARILRRHAEKIGYTSHFTVYDTDDSKRLIKECQRRLHLTESALPHKTILAQIGRCKDSLITPQEYLKHAGSDVRKINIGKCYEMYQREIKKADAMDFDDMLFNTVTLLEQNEDIRRFYQNKFRYICVDEYQDTNHAQFRLTELMCGREQNICVVGDDDQSIYRFRGATIENILSFEKRYKSATIIRLEQNYRSTGTILDAANSVIENNRGRKGKTLWTANGVGEKITVYKASDEHDEARYIAEKIEENVASGKFNFGDHAILYRMNAQSNVLEQCFARAGIPHRIIGGQRFYDRAEIRDAIAYLTVVNNPSDNIRLTRIINVPKRGIGTASINAAMQIADGLGVSLFEVISHADEYEALKRSANKMMDFAETIQDISTLVDEVSLDELFNDILKRTDYLQYLDLDREKGQERKENISQLINNLISYESQNDDATLSGFLEEVSLLTDIDNYNAQTDAVVMMTLHSAKGLEFPVVFIPGMEEGVFPGVQSVYGSSEDIEEERRLAYVGITRAKKKLYLLNANSRMVFGTTGRNLPSRFVGEIDPDLIEESGSFSGNSFYNYRPAVKSKETLERRDTFMDNKDDELELEKKDSTSTLAYSGSGYLAKHRKEAASLTGTPAPIGIEYNQGDTVVSKVFGQGVVLSVKKMGNDSMLEIAFETAGTKKLMANYAKLEKK